MLITALILFFGGLLVAGINMAIMFNRFEMTRTNVVAHLLGGLGYVSGIVLFLIWMVQTLAS